MADQLELEQAHTRAQIQRSHPATGEGGGSYDRHTIDQAHDAAAAARRAFLTWRRTPFAERSSIIRKAGAILRQRKDEFARLMTEEMGKTLDEGRAEVEKCAFQCDWFADHAEQYLAREPVDIGGAETLVTFNSNRVGVAVLSREFPCWEGFFFPAPALHARNSRMLKDSRDIRRLAHAHEE